MNLRAILFSVLLAATAVSAPGIAGAQVDDKGDSLGPAWAPQQDEAREGVRRGNQVPLPMVIMTIQRRVPGRLLDAGLEYFAGRPIYRIRWLTNDGRRLDLLVDASTGAIIGR